MDCEILNQKLTGYKISKINKTNKKKRKFDAIQPQNERENINKIDNKDKIIKELNEKLDELNNEITDYQNIIYDLTDNIQKLISDNGISINEDSDEVSNNTNELIYDEQISINSELLI